MFSVNRINKIKKKKFKKKNLYISTLIITKTLWFKTETINWKAALDNNETVGSVMMDLSKAFDSLPHDLLIAKLSTYNVSDSACAVLFDYLHDRHQRVKIGHTVSTWQSLSKGVPQGSILGPLLFNIFLNDLVYFVEKCLLTNYADDNSLSHHNTDPIVVKNALEHDTQICIKWFTDNFMSVNPEKFQAITLGEKLSETRTMCKWS